MGRTWLTRRPRWGRPRGREIASDSLLHIGPSLPDLGSLDLGEDLLLVGAVVAVLVILIPVLFLGIELVIVGVLLAAGVIARTLLRQPWVVVARSDDSMSSGRLLEWRVRGWRQSGQLIGRVAAELSAGRDPRDVSF